MCTVCGCGNGETRIEEMEVMEHEHTHVHADGTIHRHSHAPTNTYRPRPTNTKAELDYSTGPAGAHVPGLSQSRMVQIEQDILAKNNDYASANRRHFDERGIFALNLVSSPGSGKTTLLVKTIELLKDTV